jgi:hypothetical protein
MVGGIEETPCESMTLGTREVVGRWQEPGRDIVGAGEDGHLGTGHRWPFLFQHIQIT